MNNLDELLSQPLPPVADNGFSERVVARVKAEEQRKTVLFAIAAVVGTTLLCLLVPMPEIVHSLGGVAVQLSTSPLVPLAIGALVLTFLVDRAISDRSWLQL